MQYNSNAPDRRDRALQVVLHVAPMQRHFSPPFHRTSRSTPVLWFCSSFKL